MKKILAVILALVLICSATFYGVISKETSGVNSDDSFSSGDYVNSNDSVNSDDSVSSGDSVSSNAVANFVEYVPTPSIPNLIGRTPKNTESWSVTAINNYIPVTPQGYDGTMVDITWDYTGKDGKQTTKTYHAAFITDMESLKDYSDYSQYSSLLTDVEVNGELQTGRFLRQVETLFFLECRRIDDTRSLYFLDIDISNSVWYSNVLDINSEKALIAAENYLFTYNFDSLQCELITKDAFDYNYEDNGKIYFVDWLHDEYVCDWSKSSDTTATGQKVIHYEDDDFSLVADDTFTSDFEVMQDALRAGYVNEEYFAHLYDIYSFGGIYDNGGSYLSNIHLPAPYAYNRNAIFSSRFGCWLTEGSILTFYRYGDKVRDYDLGDGLWKVINTNINYREVHDTDCRRYDIDTDGDELISADELDGAILSTQILLYNAKDHGVYLLDDGHKESVKIAGDVVDYCDAYGQLYWMNSKFEAYELSWLEDDISVLIGKDVVGISQHTDERAGFVVKPGDSRCNVISGGTSLCTLYGDDWLNQKETSGAWALERSWDPQS